MSLLAAVAALSFNSAPLTGAQLRQLDVFLSNFAEADQQPFQTGRLSDKLMTDFMMVHVIYNSAAAKRTYNAKEVSHHSLALTLTEAGVNKVTDRYFGRRISNHSEMMKYSREMSVLEVQDLPATIPPQRPVYLVCYYEPEVLPLARAYVVEGDYPRKFTVYGAEFDGGQQSSDYNGQSPSRFLRYSVQRSPTEAGRFILTELSTLTHRNFEAKYGRKAAFVRA